MTLPIERKYTLGAYALMIIFFIIATILILISVIGYNNKYSYEYNKPQIECFLIGLVSIIIACIPFMYNSPVIPTLVKFGNNITVTNSNSLGSNPKLELYRIIPDGQLFDVPNATFDKTANSWFSPSGFVDQYVVRHYKGGLVYCQSASF